MSTQKCSRCSNDRVYLEKFNRYSKQCVDCNAKHAAIGRKRRAGGGERIQRQQMCAVWRAMIDRCYNKKNRMYRNYGGRGIRVCDAWRDSVETFLKDVGPKPSPEHSIDRYPNNDGNYEPSNIRWATRSEQQYNRRPKKITRFVTFHGETLPLREWARRIDMSFFALSDRLNKGWSVEDALTRPSIRITKRQIHRRGTFQKNGARLWSPASRAPQ